MCEMEKDIRSDATCSHLTKHLLHGARVLLADVVPRVWHHARESCRAGGQGKADVLSACVEWLELGMTTEAARPRW